MFWFDKADERAVMIDQREGRWEFVSSAYKSGVETVVVSPDIVADFTALPFPDNNFSLVVFDPPHLTKHGETGLMVTKYGKLRGEWKEMIQKGFIECFRVLKLNSTLIFKWSETDVPLSEVLSLTDAKPLFGNKSPKKAGSHWIVFFKS